MPSYLDFDSTKKFRDFILAKTLNVPNGPQTFNSTNYAVQTLNDEPNVNPGAVDTNRDQDLIPHKTKNTFKPLTYYIKESLEDLPRRANLSLYSDDSGNPYFVAKKHNLVGIMSNNSYENESELFKFAASYIRDTNQKGPVYSRIQQNLYKSTVGRVRLIDALEGNTATAINIITGREPLIESNFNITVSKTQPGKAVDFLQTVAGTQLPFSTIPGDYFAPAPNPLNTRPTPNSEFGKILQDASGALGSLLGIARRPKSIRKPSDLFIEYMGSGQKQVLFDQLTYNTYAPNYTTTARSQNTSKVFNFVDKVAQGVKTALGSEAPKGTAYIGDDRGDSVLNAMSDLNQRPVRSSYYLSLMFDPVQTLLFDFQKNLTEGGQVSGPLTWKSINSRNQLGANNEQYGEQRSQLESSLSTNGNFRHDSILGYTQDILDSMPSDGGEARSHVANVIDQTSRIFREGNKYLSRGSAIKYVDKYGQENGVEYCRTWTKDRPYLSYNDTMKKGMNTRKYEGSVMTNPWNLNIAPMSDGNKGFDSSSNIFNGYRYGPDKDGKSFYAKKYMFSIENLAWKTSNKPGFTVLDLPFSERGPNGGRVMWFPPYDLKITEANNARWDTNNFLGRPEPIFTYNSTERSGTISFKVVVDHPSILNLLTREFFKNMSEEESDNYINAFFAGCENLDFYDLIRKYTTLSKNDEELIRQYLNEGGNPEVITKYKTVIEPITEDTKSTTVVNQNTGGESKHVLGETYTMYFDNNQPSGDPNLTSNDEFNTLVTNYVGLKETYKTQLEQNLNTLSPLTTDNAKSDKLNIYGNDSGTGSISDQKNKLNGYFTKFISDYNSYQTNVTNLKQEILSKKVSFIELKITSATSSVASVDYNKRLSFRRSNVLIKDFFSRISNGKTPALTWPSNTDSETITAEYSLKDFGYDELVDAKVIVTINNYGESFTGNSTTPLDTNCKNRDFKEVNNLNIVAPISFYCRHSEIKFDKTIVSEPQKPVNPEPTKKNKTVKTSVSEDGPVNIYPKVKKPPIDVMKRIIMKTLSESYYFKKLEENSPLVFKSLKEKLRYFHPGFHSMTPEGLNSRLTFLLQCVRPGDTIPIKGVADDLDINARNTTFGPPPVCVLRIGDFYHSKIIIRDVNINYDEGVWDMNPEGIGMQPMIATVSLSVNFIGGQGLEKPVERLQNALSSNFFANTEIYDERSETTNSKIGGKNTAEFTKEFLEDLQNRGQKEIIPEQQISPTPTTLDKYIGSLNNNKLDYTDKINEVYNRTNLYIESFKQTYNDVNQKYGPLISNLIFSNTYRSVNSYGVYTSAGSSPGRTINLLGIYPANNDFGNLIRLFIYTIKETIKTADLATIMGLNVYVSAPKATRLNTILIPYVTNVVTKMLNDLIDSNPLIGLENSQNELIKSMDFTNHIVKYGEDIKFTGVSATNAVVATLSGSINDVYNEIKNAVDYINTNSPSFYTDLNTSINFNSPSINNTQLSQILSVMLINEVSNILTEIRKQPTIFDSSIMSYLEEGLYAFVQPVPAKVFTFTPLIERNKSLIVSFDVSGETPTTSGNNVTEGLKVLSTKTNITTSNLNFYRK